MLSLAIFLLLQEDFTWLVRDLSDESAAVRDRATEELTNAGERALPWLIPMVDSKDLEVSARSRAIIERIGFPALEQLDKSGSASVQALANRIVLSKAGEYLKDGRNSTVEWRTPKRWDVNAELERGSGSGHGSTLDWIRFRPDEEGVAVLSIEYRAKRTPYRSKFPPDRAPVTVRKATMTKADYQALLRVLGAFGSARLKVRSSRTHTITSSNFWSMVRVSLKGKPLFDEAYTGYRGSTRELQYARVEAAERWIGERLKSLTFKKHTLTDGERKAVSERFICQWKRFAGRKSNWWVRERLLITVGVVGDRSALTQLRSIIADRTVGDREAYYAINAATRLIGTDVRDEPVEEMNLNATRKKILKLIDELEE